MFEKSLSLKNKMASSAVRWWEGLWNFKNILFGI